MHARYASNSYEKQRVAQEELEKEVTVFFFIRKSWEKWVRMVDAVQYFHFVAADVI